MVSLRRIYSIMLGFGGEAKQEGDDIITTHVQNGLLFYLHFIINRENGYIEYVGIKSAVPIG